MDIKGYFDQLITLNDAERKVEEEQFLSSIGNQSLKEQANAGICWHPLQIIETGYGFGDYPFVWVERTKQRDLPHNLSPGKPVKLFSAQGNAEDAVIGILDVLRENRAKIIFLTDELPDLLDEGKLVLQAQFDMHSFKRIEEALVLIKNARNCRLAELRDILIQANSIAEKSDDEFSFTEDANLNDSQNAAVKRILTTQNVAVIHGPPGTGKTTTLVAAAEQICRQDGRILMAAPSNAAVDYLCMSLIKKGLNVLRLGNPVRISEQLESATLEGKLRNTPEYAVIRDARKQADAYRSMALKYKRQFGTSEREQRKLLLQEAKALVQDANRLEQSLCDALYHSADVICGTLMGVHTHLPKNMEFDFVCIDEAAQAIEPQCWLPLIRAQRIILAGDPHQLPPTVKSEFALKQGLSVTLMEKLLNRVPTVLLDVQYRMNPNIMAFPNQWFYGSKLKAHTSTETRYFKDESGILFVDTAGSGFEEELNPETQSIGNRGEVQFIYEHRNSLFLANREEKDFSMALIAPYSEQIRMLSKQFEELDNEWPFSFRIQSIDSFQGQESDVVLISLVRSNDKSDIGFLRDYRRMNVAMTRARYKLIMLGDSATLSADPFYDALISWCMEQGMYKSVWEFTS